MTTMFVSAGRLMIGAGAALIVVGLLVLLISKLGLNRLPGDLTFHRGPVTVFFPIATCLVLSVVLSIVMSLLARWRR